MKKAFFTFPFFLSSQTVKIKIDIDKTIGEIATKIYRVFMKPIQFSVRRMELPDSVKFNTLYGTISLRKKDGDIRSNQDFLRLPATFIYTNQSWRKKELNNTPSFINYRKN